MSEVASVIRRQGAVIVVGLLLGSTLLLTIGDQFHVQFNVLSYPSGVRLFGQAWWVAPLFAASTVGFVVLAWPFAARFADSSDRDLFAGGLWFFGTYVATAVFGHHVIPLTIAITAVWLARIAVRNDRAAVVAYAIVLAVTGTLVESLLNHAGLAHYEVRSFLLVPAWLPALYLQGAPLASALTRRLRFGQPLLESGGKAEDRDVVEEPAAELGQAPMFDRPEDHPEV